jgi:hypothetical protein
VARPASGDDVREFVGAAASAGLDMQRLSPHSLPADLAHAAAPSPVQDGLVADANSVALADRESVEAVGIEPRPGGVPDGTDAGLVGQPRPTPEESATLHSPLDELRLEVNERWDAHNEGLAWAAKVRMLGAEEAIYLRLTTHGYAMQPYAYIDGWDVKGRTVEELHRQARPNIEYAGVSDDHLREAVAMLMRVERMWACESK